MNVLTLLAERGLIQDKEIPEIEAEAVKDEVSVEAVLAKRGVPLEEVLRVKGEHFSVPTKVMDGKEVPFEVLRFIPEESATHYKFVPLGIVEGVLEVGITDPDNIEALDALNFISQKEDVPFKVYLISESDFERILGVYKGLKGEVGRAISELETEFQPGKSDEDESHESTKLSEDEIKEEAPVTKIVATILRDAV